VTKDSNARVPVLMYHALEDEAHPSGAKDLGEQVYVLQVNQFLEQMEYLKKNEYQTFFISELVSLKKWPVKAVVLTFDDGHESNYALALPILQSFGFKA
jgi:peptidoglycan/xylan/chitin deacetylase (PgdA/CDA1 family)